MIILTERLRIKYPILWFYGIGAAICLAVQTKESGQLASGKSDDSQLDFKTMLFFDQSIDQNRCSLNEIREFF